MAGELILYVAEEGADAERVEQLTGYLRSELADLDLVGSQVSVLREGELPPGARALDVVALGGLLVKLGQSSGAIRSVVSAVIHWLDRSPNRGRTVRIELEGDVLVLSEASEVEEARLVELFVARHTSRDG